MAGKQAEKGRAIDKACLCGARIKGEGSTEIIQALELFWHQEHRGSGHGAATVEQAKRARTRLDRRAAEQRFLESD